MSVYCVMPCEPLETWFRMPGGIIHMRLSLRTTPSIWGGLLTALTWLATKSHGRLSRHNPLSSFPSGQLAFNVSQTLHFLPVMVDLNHYLWLWHCNIYLFRKIPGKKGSPGFKVGASAPRTKGFWKSRNQIWKENQPKMVLGMVFPHL
jgi:hypothetical protein